MLFELDERKLDREKLEELLKPLAETSVITIGVVIASTSAATESDIIIFLNMCISY